MLKKIVIILLCLVMGALLYNFCRPVEEDKIVLDFASWGSESEINILKPILENFEEENPDIKINFMHIPQNYFQKIHLLFASNTAPDVLFMNNQYLPVYANAGVLEDLTNKNFDFDKFYSKSLESLKYQGKIYGVPRDISNLVVFYNKEIFRKNNMDYPSSGWDLEDFLFIAKKLTNLPKVYGISFEEAPLFYLPYMTTCGGWREQDTKDFFKKNVLGSGKNAQGLKFYSNLRHKFHVAPLKEESASATMAQMFLQGRLAMQVSGRWLVPKYRQEASFDWDIVEFPAYKHGSKSIVPLDSSGWVISKNSKHKKEAEKFIKYLSSKESIEKFTKSGLIVPARVDVAQSEIFLDSKKPQNAKAFLSAINSALPTPVTVNYREIIDAMVIENEYLFNKQ